MWLMVVIVAFRRNINLLYSWIALSVLVFMSTDGLSEPSSSSYSASTNQIYPKAVFLGKEAVEQSKGGEDY